MLFQIERTDPKFSLRHPHALFFLLTQKEETTLQDNLDGCCKSSSLWSEHFFKPHLSPLQTIHLLLIKFTNKSYQFISEWFLILQQKHFQHRFKLKMDTQKTSLNWDKFFTRKHYFRSKMENGKIFLRWCLFFRKPQIVKYTTNDWELKLVLACSD